jgi:hypothetical protein
VYDCLRVFLLEHHPYRRDEFSFNGKPKRTQRLEIMKLMDWNKAYDTEKKKEMT